MLITLPLDPASLPTASISLAVREAILAEDALRSLGGMVLAWSPDRHRDGRCAGYSRESGRPEITLYRGFVETALALGGGDREWSVANMVAGTPAEWAAATVIHEVGHHRLRECWRTKRDSEPSVTLLPEVSRYAGESHDERFAEAYAWWRSGGGLPRVAEAVMLASVT